MDPIFPGLFQNRGGLIYRLNGGYRFRVAGGNAHNDGIQAEMDIGYQSQRFCDGQLSLESGSSLDFFGETEHLGAYLQLNVHPRDRWIFSFRTLGAGVSDDKEAKSSPAAAPNSAAEAGDSDDLGGALNFSLMGSYRIDRNFLVGIRFGYHMELFGNKGTDQGTQHSLATLINLAYQF